MWHERPPLRTVNDKKMGVALKLDPRFLCYKVKEPETNNRLLFKNPLSQ